MGTPDSKEIFLRAISKNWRTRKARIGEKSRPPIGGRNILKGLQIWFDICWIKRIAGWELIGATQLIIIPIRRDHHTILRINRRVEYSAHVNIEKILKSAEPDRDMQ